MIFYLVFFFLPLLHLGVCQDEFPPQIWNQIGNFTFANQGASSVDPNNSQLSRFTYTNGAPYPLTVTLTITPSGNEALTFNGTTISKVATLVVPALTDTPTKFYEWDRVTAQISWNSKRGAAGAVATQEFNYPWTGTYRVDQAFFGTSTHSGAGNEHNWHAIDANLPTGTPVLAARRGIVVGIESAQADGTGVANYVRLLHPDGSTSNYVHLRPPPGNVNVSLGDGVEPGALLGYSGETGMASGPHLHFSVSAPDGTKTTPPTVPWTFPGGCVPLKGETYPGGACGVASQPSSASSVKPWLSLTYIVYIWSFIIRNQ